MTDAVVMYSNDLAATEALVEYGLEVVPRERGLIGCVVRIPITNDKWLVIVTPFDLDEIKMKRESA
jgi:hypothetical protein